MSWKKVENVLVGSVIYDENDNEHTVVDRVVENGVVTDLLLEAKPFPISLKGLVINNAGGDEDAWDDELHDIYVESEPSSHSRSEIEAARFAWSINQPSALKATIEARFGTPTTSAVNSLKSQLEQRFASRNVLAVGQPLLRGVASPNLLAIGQPWVSGVDQLRSQLSQVATRANEAHHQSYALTDSVHNVQSEVESVRGHVDKEVSGLYQAMDGVFSSVDHFDERLSKLEHARVQDKLDAQQNKKASAQGGSSMSIKSLLGSFTNQFGKVDKAFALSPAGLAVKADPRNPFGGWVVYDPKTGQLTDVQDMVLKFDVPAFKLPVTADKINEGDIVVNNGEYQYVVEVNDDYISTVCPSKKSRSTVLPITNVILKQATYTVVRTLDIAGESGFNPMLLMAMGDGNKDDIMQYMLMSNLFGGGQAGAAGTAGIAGMDPMMMMMMMSGDGDGGMEDLLPLVLLQQGGAVNGQANLLPFLLMGKGGKGGLGGMSDILLMQALSGQGGANPFGNLFGAPAAAPKAPKATE